MQHVTLLADFFKQLDLGELRIQRPDPFIFFCGGVTSKNGAVPPFSSLRDYIYRKPLELEHRVVLAEDAVKLFQDSKYSDLITFEAHIAQISELVLLVCESPGSLAELGAFCLKPTIVERLYAVIPEEHSESDSFVRLGPLRLVAEKNSDAVGAFPWTETRDANGKTEIVISPDYDNAIIKAIERNLTKPKTEKFSLVNDGHKMILLYWACFMLRAATRKELAEFIKQVGLNEIADELDRYMYCMIVAGWIRKRNIGSEYYIPHHDRDPFQYAYRLADPANPAKATSLKAEIAEHLTKSSLRPQQILDAIGAGDPAEVLG